MLCEKPDPRQAEQKKASAFLKRNLAFVFTICGTLSPLRGRLIFGAARYRKLLGHSQARTTQRYAHLDADPMHKAANLIGVQIAAAMNALPR